MCNLVALLLCVLAFSVGVGFAESENIKLEKAKSKELTLAKIRHARLVKAEVELRKKVHSIGSELDNEQALLEHVEAHQRQERHLAGALTWRRRKLMMVRLAAQEHRLKGAIKRMRREQHRLQLKMEQTRHEKVALKAKSARLRREEGDRSILRRKTAKFLLKLKNEETILNREMRVLRKAYLAEVRDAERLGGRVSNMSMDIDKLDRKVAMASARLKNVAMREKSEKDHSRGQEGQQSMKLKKQMHVVHVLMKTLKKKVAEVRHESKTVALLTVRWRSLAGRAVKEVASRAEALKAAYIAKAVLKKKLGHMKAKVKNEAKKLAHQVAQGNNRLQGVSHTQLLLAKELRNNRMLVEQAASKLKVLVAKQAKRRERNSKALRREKRRAVMAIRKLKSLKKLLERKSESLRNDLLLERRAEKAARDKETMVLKAMKHDGDELKQKSAAFEKAKAQSKQEHVVAHAQEIKLYKEIKHWKGEVKVISKELFDAKRNAASILKKLMGERVVAARTSKKLKEQMDSYAKYVEKVSHLRSKDMRAAGEKETYAASLFRKLKGLQAKSKEEVRSRTLQQRKYALEMTATKRARIHGERRLKAERAEGAKIAAYARELTAKIQQVKHEIADLRDVGIAIMHAAKKYRNKNEQKRAHRVMTWVNALKALAHRKATNILADEELAVKSAMKLRQLEAKHVQLQDRWKIERAKALGDLKAAKAKLVEISMVRKLKMELRRFGAEKRITDALKKQVAEGRNRLSSEKMKKTRMMRKLMPSIAKLKIYIKYLQAGSMGLAAQSALEEARAKRIFSHLRVEEARQAQKIKSDEAHRSKLRRSKIEDAKQIRNLRVQMSQELHNSRKKMATVLRREETKIHALYQKLMKEQARVQRRTMSFRKAKASLENMGNEMMQMHARLKRDHLIVSRDTSILKQKLEKATSTAHFYMALQSRIKAAIAKDRMKETSKLKQDHVKEEKLHQEIARTRRQWTQFVNALNREKAKERADWKEEAKKAIEFQRAQELLKVEAEKMTEFNTAKAKDRRALQKFLDEKALLIHELKNVHEKIAHEEKKELSKKMARRVQDRKRKADLALAMRNMRAKVSAVVLRGHTLVHNLKNEQANVAKLRKSAKESKAKASVLFKVEGTKLERVANRNGAELLRLRHEKARLTRILGVDKDRSANFVKSMKHIVARLHKVLGEGRVLRDKLTVENSKMTGERRHEKNARMKVNHLIGRKMVMLAGEVARIKPLAANLKTAEVKLVNELAHTRKQRALYDAKMKALSARLRHEIARHGVAVHNLAQIKVGIAHQLRKQQEHRATYIHTLHRMAKEKKLLHEKGVHLSQRFLNMKGKLSRDARTLKMIKDHESNLEREIASATHKIRVGKINLRKFLNKAGVKKKHLARKMKHVMTVGALALRMDRAKEGMELRRQKAKEERQLHEAAAKLSAMARTIKRQEIAAVLLMRKENAKVVHDLEREKVKEGKELNKARAGVARLFKSLGLERSRVKKLQLDRLNAMQRYERIRLEEKKYLKEWKSMSRKATKDKAKIRAEVKDMQKLKKEKVDEAKKIGIAEKKLNRLVTRMKHHKIEIVHLLRNQKSKARHELRGKEMEFAEELRRDDQKQAQLRKKLESQIAKATLAINREKAWEAMELRKLSEILAKARTDAIKEAARLARKLSEEVARKAMMYSREKAEIAQKRREETVTEAEAHKREIIEISKTRSLKSEAANLAREIMRARAHERQLAHRLMGEQVKLSKKSSELKRHHLKEEKYRRDLGHVLLWVTNLRNSKEKFLSKLRHARAYQALLLHKIHRETMKAALIRVQAHVQLGKEIRKLQFEKAKRVSFTRMLKELELTRAKELKAKHELGVTESNIRNASIKGKHLQTQLSSEGVLLTEMRRKRKGEGVRMSRHEKQLRQLKAALVKLEQNKASEMRLKRQLVAEEAALLRKLKSVRNEVTTMKKQLRRARRSLPGQRRKMKEERAKEKAKIAKENSNIELLKIKERILIGKIKQNRRWYEEMLPQAVTEFGKKLKSQLLRDLMRERKLIHATRLTEEARLRQTRKNEKDLKRRLRSAREKETNEAQHEKHANAKMAQESHEYMHEINLLKELKKKNLDLLHQKREEIKHIRKLRSDQSRIGSLSAQNRAYQKKIKELRSEMRQAMRQARIRKRAAFRVQHYLQSAKGVFKRLLLKRKAFELRLRRALRHFKRL